MQTISGKPIVKREALYRTGALTAREAKPAGGSTPKKMIVGLIPYNSKSVSLGGFYEIISPGAFRETMQKGADVKALFAHDIARPLGRVKNGSLLLKDTSQGLECTVMLPQTSYAEDLYQLIKRGDVNTMSFGFNQAKTREESKGGEIISYLVNVNLLEVSFGVVFPAYEDTTSQARIKPGSYARYVSSLATEELIRLHAAFCSPSSLKEGKDGDAKRFLAALNNAMGRV
jgi:HK97 family phage prohead protease